MWRCVIREVSIRRSRPSTVIRSISCDTQVLGEHEKSAERTQRESVGEVRAVHQHEKSAERTQCESVADVRLGHQHAKSAERTQM